MSDNKTEKLNWDPYWMICNANSLWEAAKHLAADMEVQSDSFLFSGKLMSAPLQHYQADRSAVPRVALLPYHPGKAGSTFDKFMTWTVRGPMLRSGISWSSGVKPADRRW